MKNAALGSFLGYCHLARLLQKRKGEEYAHIMRHVCDFDDLGLSGWQLRG